MGKRLLISACFLASFAVMGAAATADVKGARTADPFPDGARVAFFGDSITQNGVAVTRVAAHYRKMFPNGNVRCFNVGISGGTVGAAHLYFDSWLAPLKPTHVVVGFGVNDAGAAVFRRNAKNKAAELKRIESVAAAFERRYGDLLDRIEALGAKVILRAPTPYDEFSKGPTAAGKMRRNAQAGRNEAQRRMAESVRRIAAARKLPLVDDFAALSPYMNGADVPFEADRIHPNPMGLWLLAKNLLSAQGLEIGSFKPLEEVAQNSGLTAWREASLRLSRLLSVEWLLVRNESLDKAGKLAKVHGWLAKNEKRKGANPWVVARARQYVEDKPREAALRAEEEAAWAASLLRLAQRYTPVPGGFEIRNGASEFMRPLYGWHGDDDFRKPKRSMPCTSDRPKVALKAFDGMRLDKKPRGVLSFGDGSEDVTFRYVWGRAEYDLKGKGAVKMVRSASSDGLLVEVAGDLQPTFGGEWTLAAKAEKDGRTYYDFVRKSLPRAAGPDPAAAFAAATDRVERIARTIEIKTPDPLIDSLLPCQLVAADAVFEGSAMTHGATNWRVPYAGWRVGYVCLATAWNERFRENARLFFKAQRSDGRIPCRPDKDQIYNMNEVFVDSVLRYWRWTGDDDFMRECAYEGVKRHLAWMDAKMKVPGMDLYENKLNAWNTDNKWCSGGAGTIASAYVAFACRTMAEIAGKLGKTDDAAHFAARAKSVEDAIAVQLWDEGTGVWGEYRERFALKRLVGCPDLSSVYTAIDSLPPDLARNRRAVFWVEDNIPSHFTGDGVAFLYSSNRLPLFYSSCGRYQNENFHWALACYLTGEPELGWRNLHSALEISARGVMCGPGATFYDLDFDLAAPYGHDFSDTVGVFLRAVVEGVFGIRDGKAVVPSFPETWDAAQIKSPTVSYSWTRKDGVKPLGGGKVAVLPAPKPAFVGVTLPKPHSRWGKAKGEGSDCAVPAGAAADYVDMSAAFNQNWRELHTRTYLPRFHRNSNVEKNGRAAWERSEATNNRRWPRDYCVPKKLDWPTDGVLKTKYGPTFRLGPKDGANSVFASLYSTFPDEVTLPLSGRARKLAFLSALSTNPNIAWVDAAKVVVEYTDGTSETLALLPPDNCDDWLNYSTGQWSYYDRSRDDKPYAVKGNPVMFGETAHANVHAIALDPSKELKCLRLVCCGKETIVGIIAVTLYRDGSLLAH